MLEKPDLADAAIAACLREGYGITAARIEFLPLGQDDAAWVYRVTDADGTPYFLKIRRPPTDELRLALPRYLRDSGLGFVVAPLLAIDGTLWQSADGFVLVLYPFIEARSGMEGGLSLTQWEAFGAGL